MIPIRLVLYTGLYLSLGVTPLYTTYIWWDLLTHALGGYVLARWILLVDPADATFLCVFLAAILAFERLELWYPHLLGSAKADLLSDLAAGLCGAAVASIHDRHRR